MASRTSAASPSMPLRKSTGLVATMTRTVPVGPITRSPSTRESPPIRSRPWRQSPIRTLTPPISSSIGAIGAACCRRRRCVDASSTIAGTKLGPASSLRLRASRRQPNNCCGVSPCRRATTDTDAPASSVSSTIRALSSTVQRRRPPAPVINSMRRTGCSGSSVGSSLDTSRSPFSHQDQHHHRSGPRQKGGLRTPLTMN